MNLSLLPWETLTSKRWPSSSCASTWCLLASRPRMWTSRTSLTSQPNLVSTSERVVTLFNSLISTTSSNGATKSNNKSSLFSLRSLKRLNSSLLTWPPWTTWLMPQTSQTQPCGTTRELSWLNLPDYTILLLTWSTWSLTSTSEKQDASNTLLRALSCLSRPTTQHKLPNAKWS